MTFENKVGWAVLALAFVLTLLYGCLASVASPEKGPLDGYLIAMNAVVVVHFPAYILLLVFMYKYRSRRLPRRFVAGAVSYFLTIIVWLALGRRIHDSATWGAIGLAMLCVSWIIIKPGFEHAMWNVYDAKEDEAIE